MIEWLNEDDGDAGHSKGVHRLMQGGPRGLAGQGASHPSCPRPCPGAPHPLQSGLSAQLGLLAPVLPLRHHPGWQPAGSLAHTTQSEHAQHDRDGVACHARCILHNLPFYADRLEAARAHW